MPTAAARATRLTVSDIRYCASCAERTRTLMTHFSSTRKPKHRLLPEPPTHTPAQQPVLWQRSDRRDWQLCVVVSLVLTLSVFSLVLSLFVFSLTPPPPHTHTTPTTTPTQPTPKGAALATPSTVSARTVPAPSVSPMTASDASSAAPRSTVRAARAAPASSRRDLSACLPTAPSPTSSERASLPVSTVLPSELWGGTEKEAGRNHSLTPQPNSSDAYDASIPGCTCCEGLKVREGFPQCENDDRRRRLRMLEDEDKEEKIAVVVVAA